MTLASENTTELAAPDGTIGISRLFTSPGVNPYDEVVWERRDARITNWKDGSVAFEQLDVEFPETWSVNATNIVAQKYFRGTLGTPERETSLRQVSSESFAPSPPGAERVDTSQTMPKKMHSLTNFATSS